MQVRTFSSVESIQNISLKKLAVINSSYLYEPVITRMFFSANNTLFILTESLNRSLGVDPVFYIYTSKQCAFDKRNVSNECMCKPYYWENFTSKNGSKVGEMRQCHCGYFENVKEKTCLCPIWNGYQTDGMWCGCGDGY